MFEEYSGILRWRRPRGGMTAFPSIEGVSDTREFCEVLLRRGVMVVPGDCFEMPSHFRLGFAAASTGFSQALERVSDAVTAMGAVKTRA